MKATRRKFLRLLAAGTTAAALAPAAKLANAAAEADTKPRPAPKPAGPPREEGAPPARSAAVSEEVRKQKGYVAETLKTVRGYTLPPGSEMAFAFKPLKARARKRTP